MPLYDLRNEFQVQKFKDYCNKMIDEKAVCELKKKYPQRSLNQNSYAHVLFGYFASEFGYSIDYVKYEFFKKKCNPDIFIVKRENKRGQVVDYIRSSSSLDTAEFTTALERFRAWSSSEAGLYLPSPNEEEALVYAMQQLEQYKEFA